MASRKERRAARRGREPQVRAKQAARISPALQALAYATVLAVGVLAYLPTLRYEFLTSWDDPTYIVDNPWIRSWSRENLTFVFTKPYFANFLPLHLVSYMVDYSFWKLEPFGYHLQSMILNALNGALALLVVRRMFGSFALAFVAALLFAVHPSHVEAVAWLSIRKDLLSTTFLFLAVYFYLRAGDGKSLRVAPYAGSLICFTLGLLTKITIVALPLFLLLLDHFRDGGRRIPWMRGLASKIPYLAVGFWLVHLNSLAQVKAKAAYAHDFLSYFAVKGQAAWNYLALLTGIPQGRPIYDTPVIAANPGAQAASLAGLVVLPALLWIAHRRGSRTVALGAGWMFTLLLPAFAFPLVTYMADRYLYAPSLGFCWMLSAGILAVGAKFGSAAARAATVALLAAVPFSLFAFRTMEYNPAWRNSETLWTYALQRSADIRVRNNLAQALANRGQWDEAERLYKLGALVENVISYQGLATVYYNTKRYADAGLAIDKAFEVAAKKGADSYERADILYSRGAIYWVLSQREKAAADWEAALRANPAHARAREWLEIAQGKRPIPK